LRHLVKTCIAGAAAIAAMAAMPARALVIVDGPLPLVQDDLDQLVAPIALYPDPLLAQVLAAATYPAEVGEAVKFSDENPALRNQELALVINRQQWEPSVAALIQFPGVLDMMRENPAWVRNLGDAVLEQEAAVMQTVQTLRSLAWREGALQPTAQQKVFGDSIIIILPARPREVCMPIYDAATVYGEWWLPDKPPMTWKPRRKGAPRIHTLGSGGLSFAPCDMLSSAPFVSAVPDWDNLGLKVSGRGQSGAWEHDPAHRRGAPYRTPLVRARFEPAGDQPGAQRGGRSSRTGQGLIIIRPKPQAPPPAEAEDGR
jgi:hypothetical protein